MLGCWKVRGILAASTYEKLNPDDQALLDTHLGGCARCGEKLAAFRTVKSAVPVELVRLETDLMPGIRRGLDGPPSKESIFRPLPMAAAVTAFAIVGISALVLYPASGPSDAVNLIASSPAGSPLDAAFAEAESFIDEQNYMAAYLALLEGKSAHSEDSRAGDAQQVVADLTFAELKMYEQSLEAYQELRSDYGHAWRANVEHNFMRLNLLEESRMAEKPFASLYRLDAARASGDFEAYEEIVGQNQLTYVADLAMEEMAFLMLKANGGHSGNDYAVAMEAALDNCSNPAAIAMLRYKLGDLIRNGGDDPGRAQTLLKQVAEDNTNPALAGRAQVSLTAMQTDSSR
ncbi:MAG: hypothetical protein QGG73_06505 [Candidatus Hydrogenedentes bacterium]|nr:hypothetical protein [Candidatus Hydrogenedentota bacterium]